MSNLNQNLQSTADAFSRSRAAANVSDGREGGGQGDACAYCGATLGAPAVYTGPRCTYCGIPRRAVVWVADAEGDAMNEGKRGFYLWADQCEAEVLARAVPVPPEDIPETYRVEYVTRRGDGWASNALTFDTVEAAEQEARDRAFRWTAVRLARVVPTSTPEREACDFDNPGDVVVDYR